MERRRQPTRKVARLDKASLVLSRFDLLIYPQMVIPGNQSKADVDAYGGTWSREVGNQVPLTPLRGEPHHSEMNMHNFSIAL